MYAFDVTHFSFILVTALLLSLLKDDDDDDDDARKEKQQRCCCCAVTVNDGAIFVVGVGRERARACFPLTTTVLFVLYGISFEMKRSGSNANLFRVAKIS